MLLAELLSCNHTVLATAFVPSPTSDSTPSTKLLDRYNKLVSQRQLISNCPHCVQTRVHRLESWTDWYKYSLVELTKVEGVPAGRLVSGRSEGSDYRIIQDTNWTLIVKLRADIIIMGQSAFVVEFET